jgi:hypothetical protein
VISSGRDIRCSDGATSPIGSSADRVRHLQLPTFRQRGRDGPGAPPGGGAGHSGGGLNRGELLSSSETLMSDPLVRPVAAPWAVLICAHLFCAAVPVRADVERRRRARVRGRPNSSWKRPCLRTRWPPGRSPVRCSRTIASATSPTAAVTRIRPSVTSTRIRNDPLASPYSLRLTVATDIPMIIGST